MEMNRRKIRKEKENRKRTEERERETQIKGREWRDDRKVKSNKSSMKPEIGNYSFERVGWIPGHIYICRFYHSILLFIFSNLLVRV